MSIGKPDALSELARVHRKFGASLEELRLAWGSEDPPLVFAMATLGQTLSSNIEDFSDDELRRLGCFVESILTGTDEIVATAIATGFLESLLAASSAGKLDFETIAPHLGVHSKQYCKAWDTFTGCHTPGLGGVAGAESSKPRQGGCGGVGDATAGASRTQPQPPSRQ